MRIHKKRDITNSRFSSINSGGVCDRVDVSGTITYISLFIMVQLTSLAILLGLAGATVAAPTGGATITVNNHCGHNIQVNQMTNGASSGHAINLAAGATHKFTVPSNWGGRFWGREECSGSGPDCNPSAPASLAEFLLNGYSDKDFYDVSLVDGFNLPMDIKPSGSSDGSGNSAEKYACGIPACTTLPSCPEDLQVKGDNGKVIGCKSACSAFGTDEFCCQGAHNSPETCQPNEYSSVVKAVCPDAYSFAYDDASSTFSCSSSGYTVTFCPA
ncbi:thaumatin [Radiomyces spectabilis]|uniref:thaumatin n=1 Tax=Radiomyces spectabilis TaxID=64574 RepID=UPI0022203E3E|nr:thaumatin [Radiomyces spectabilis]KAI8368098.1 thaumatin [Radiomyces spectabilis]